MNSPITTTATEAIFEDELVTGEAVAQISVVSISPVLDREAFEKKVNELLMQYQQNKPTGQFF